MRLARLTTRGIMIGIAVAAVLLGGPSHPELTIEADPLGWSMAMIATNALPLVIFPLIVRFDRPRRWIAWAASAAIVAAQAACQAPANSVGFVGSLAVWGIAGRARDSAELGSAILAIACGVSAGLACGYNPCTPFEVVLAPAVGLVVRASTRRGLGTGRDALSARRDATAKAFGLQESAMSPLETLAGATQALIRLRRRDRAREC